MLTVCYQISQRPRGLREEAADRAIVARVGAAVAAGGHRARSLTAARHPMLGGRHGGTGPESRPRKTRDP